MAHHDRLKEKVAERAAEMAKQAIIESFVKEQDGKVAELFLKRIRLVRGWLTRIQPIFSNYKKSFHEFKKFEELTPRLPKSNYITQLSLDISPRMSELLSELPKLKRDLYEAIRSTRIKKGTTQRLDLDKDERNKLIAQFNLLAPAINSDNPDWSILFFPDESFSLTEEDIQNPKKPINFEFTKYSLAVNKAITRVEQELDKVNTNKRVRVTPANSQISDEAGWHHSWETPDEAILPSDSGRQDPEEGDAG